MTINMTILHAHPVDSCYKSLLRSIELKEEFQSAPQGSG